MATQYKGKEQSSISLVLFSASIIALIMFTIMKLFSARFGSASTRMRARAVGEYASSRNHARRANQDDCDRASVKTTTRVACEQKQQQQRQQQRAEYLHVNDCDRRDKKKSRMNREERTRQLILRHGGRSVSKAIRFLISELERQKQHLIEGSSTATKSNTNQQQGELVVNCCNCPCHLVNECRNCADTVIEEQRGDDQMATGQSEPSGQLCPPRVVTLSPRDSD